MATKSTKSKRDFNAFEAFSMPTSAFEVPAALREAAEQSVIQFRDTYDRMRTAAEEATELLEETMDTARESALGLSEKTLEAARSNSEAQFEFARDLFAAKTVADVVELQTAFARKQFEAASTQLKEMQELTTKFMTDTTKPVAARVEKTIKDVSAA